MLTIAKTRPVDFQIQKKNCLSTLDIFRKLPFAALQEIEKNAVTGRYAKHESIFMEEDRAESVWFVRQGIVKEINHSTSGKSQTLCMVGVGGIFGVSAFDGGQYGFHSIAETEVITLSFPIQGFLSVMGKYPDLVKAVLSKISKLLRQSKGRQTFSQECAEKRLLHVLMETTEEFGNTIPLTRKEIASMAGTAVETCIRVFSRLEEAGLIAAEHGKITVKNLDGLENRMEQL